MRNLPTESPLDPSSPTSAARTGADPAGEPVAASGVPHFLPYQGSKRLLAGRILAAVGNRRFRTLFEPFAGSAAVTLAAAHARLADRFVLGESLAPLADLWRLVLRDPDRLADEYARLWQAQLGRTDHFEQVRQAYNASQDPPLLLYLLARCVKNAPRWSAAGQFNQSPDRRRLGVRPDRLRVSVRAVAGLLHGRCEVRTGDFAAVLADAGPHDLAYLDPPWQGTSTGPDKRYHQGLRRERLVGVLEGLDAGGVAWLLSYDGRCGERTYGPPLPEALGATRLELEAGRSSQATLAGRVERTVESLYLSRGARRG